MSVPTSIWPLTPRPFDRVREGRETVNEAVNLEPRTSVFSPSERTQAVIWKIQGAGLILLTFMSFFPRWFHVQEYCFLGLLVLAVATARAEGRAVWIRTPIDLPLLLFVGWVLLTIPFATDPAYSFVEWRKVVSQVLVFYWALLVFRTEEARTLTRGVLAAVVAGIAVVSAYALIEFVTAGGSWKDRLIRAKAPSSDYNWLSTYVIIAVPMVATAASLVRRRWQRAVCGVAGGLALLAQVFSYTRAGWLGMVAQGVSFGLATRRRWVVAGVMGLCLAGLLGLLALSLAGYQQSTVSPNTFSYRLAVWGLVAEGILRHPFVGIGYGNDTYMMRFSELQESHDAPGVHSLFLMAAMGSGVPALLLLAWTFAGAVSALLRGAGRMTGSFERALAVGTAVMIIGFAVRNLFDYMWMGSLGFLFWVLVALGVAVQRATAPERPA